MVLLIITLYFYPHIATCKTVEHPQTSAMMLQVLLVVAIVIMFLSGWSY